MTKTRRIQRSKTATREVTVALRGWPQEIRQISVVDAYWYVELAFKVGQTIMTHTVFETQDYDKAKAKYDAFVRIVTD